MPVLTQTMHPGNLGEIDLQLVEHALLDALLDVGSGQTNAVDRLLSRFDTDGDSSETSAMRREELQELLSVAVMDQHPNRHRALDRILDQIKSAPAA